MSIIIEEGFGGKRSRNRTGAEQEVIYNILNTRDEDEAYAALYGHVIRNAPMLNDLPLESVETVSNEDGGKLCIGTVKYSNKKPLRGINVPLHSFSTKGGSARIIYGLALVNQYGDGIPNFGTGINYEDQKFQGVDIVVPKWSETIEITVPRTVVTNRFKRMLRGLTGKVNQHSFLDMDPGECIFFGVDARPGEVEVDGQTLPLLTYDLTFEFHAMPNVENIMIAAGIGPVKKDGQDYAWVYSVDAVDPFSNKLIKKPKGAYVVRVYDRVDFGVLGF